MASTRRRFRAVSTVVLLALLVLGVLAVLRLTGAGTQDPGLSRAGSVRQGDLQPRLGPAR